MTQKIRQPKFIALLGLLVLTGILIVACAQATASPTSAPPTQVAPTSIPTTAVPPTAVPPTPVPPTPTPTVSVSVQCLSCHGIQNIGLIVGEEAVPIYVDLAAFSQTEHGGVECTACHKDIDPTPPHNANRIYGGWARFSAKNTDVNQTRNFYTVTADACLACHTDAKYAAFLGSEHSTIKDMKFNADGSPRQEVMVQGTDGKEYGANENFAPEDCERCHINTNCGTCHWASSIKQRTEGSVLDLWAMFDEESDKAKGAMTEYGMNWTTNVATHEFRSAEALTSSNNVCTACHIGYYQGDKSVAAIGLEGTGVRRHPQVQELALSATRGVHETQQLCTNCHQDLHEMVYQNTEHGARLGGKTQCTNCHADKAMTGDVHKTVTCIGCHDAELGVHLDNGMVYPEALKHNLAESWPSHNLTKEVQCTKCHYRGNEVGAPERVTEGQVHP